MKSNNINTIKKNTTYEMIVKKLEKMILNKEFEPGEKLPSQDKLAKNFGVSRTTLREALNSLKTMGLIEVQHGNGTYVKEFEGEKFLKSFSSYMQINKKNILEVMEVRKFLEVTTVELATEKGNEKDIHNIECAFNVMKKHKNEYKKGAYDLFSKDDMQYHKAIAQATKNDLFKKILDDVQDNIRIEQIGFIKSLENVEKIIEQHRNILINIKNRNKNKAKEYMSEHIKTIETVILKAIKDNV